MIMFKALFTYVARAASFTNVSFDVKNLCRVFPRNNPKSSEYFCKLIENSILCLENGASQSEISDAMSSSLAYAKVTGASEEDINELTSVRL